MTINLKIFLIFLLVLQVVLIVQTVKKKKMTMKYASFWLVLIGAMGIVVVFPEIIFFLSRMAGFEKSSNMLFLIGFFFLFYVSFVITTTISVQNERIKQLIQEVSLLKERVEKNEEEE